MEQILAILKLLIKPTSILIVLVILLFLNSWIFQRIKIVKSYGNILKNTISIFVLFTGVLVFIFSFPINQELKGHILSFLAVILSAGVALSSTTVLGNLIAGIMNNSIKRFKNGDLIKIGDIRGRVTKKGIFHTEVQVEDSNFITFPNLYIANHPIKITRKTESIISTKVSLGYEISRNKIEDLLKEAAIKAGLTEPYVYIKDLGDYSVVYQIHGFLEDSYKYFSSISKLNGKVMDVLQKNNIEIVSPSFMNLRQVDKTIFIAKHSIKNVVENKEATPEDLVFDEAIKSEIVEEKKDYIKKLEKKEEELVENRKDFKDKDKIKKIDKSIEKIDKLKTNIENSIKKEE